MLSNQQVRKFYDWFGSRQDWQRFYEGQAIRELIQHGRFEEAQRVFEFGCGTGALAEELLANHLPETAAYLAWELSSTMVNLSRQRLARFGGRAEVQQTDGAVRLEAGDAAFDRFVSTYVLDLLPAEEIRLLLAEAHRVLQPGGRLCLVSLTHGTSSFSCKLVGAWQWLYARRPDWLGGCRPVALLDYVSGQGWEIDHHHVITVLGLPSEVVVASRQAGQP